MTDSPSVATTPTAVTWVAGNGFVVAMKITAMTAPPIPANVITAVSDPSPPPLELPPWPRQSRLGTWSVPTERSPPSPTTQFVTCFKQKMITFWQLKKIAILSGDTWLPSMKCWMMSSLPVCVLASLDFYDLEKISEQALETFTSSEVSNFWIGLTNLMTQDAWEWLDGSPVVFTNWNATQPQSITGSNCAAVIEVGGKWLTDNCFNMKPYVCAIKASAPAPKR